MYKTSLLKTLDKAGMKNRLVSLILQKNNQEKERYIEVAERIAREKDYGLVIGYPYLFPLSILLYDFDYVRLYM